ncbi:PP2C family protein-serine/threonine phosphatase [Embleya sp. NPDC020886]|uniref:PP2C family protein-serine/threonine phosphatase n=1 Tax=Embleya sp. NPDC020886 TaxID=3363980 RepID=UPI003793DCF3
MTEADPAHRRLALLDAATTRIGSTLDIDTTCAELAEFVVSAMADLAIVDLVPPDAAGPADVLPPGRARLRRAALACVPGLRTRLPSLAPPGASVRHGAESAVGQSLHTRVPVTTPGPAGPASNDPADTATALRAAGIDTTLAVPLMAHGRIVGVLLLARAPESAHDFTDEVIRLVQDLAARAAVAIDNARRYTQAQGIAVELQRALLTEPGAPHPNLDVAFCYLPSGSTSVVGGDWYEVVRLSFGRTLLVMGDVMGHGIEAAVDMSNYRSTLRQVAAMDLPPHRILRRLDALIDEKKSARPATCLLALADPGRRRWTFSSAGHLPPALIAAGRPVELVEIPTGPPLGTGVGGYEQATRALLPDETLLLYTDGLVERRDRDIDDSLAGLAALRPPTAGALEDLLDAVLLGLAPQTGEDDIAMLAARMRPR